MALICILAYEEPQEANWAIVSGAAKNTKSREGDLSSARSIRNDILFLLDDISNTAEMSVTNSNCDLSWSSWTIDFFSKILNYILHESVLAKHAFIFCESVIRQRRCRLSFYDCARNGILQAYRRNLILSAMSENQLTFHLHKPKIHRPWNKNRLCENRFKFEIDVLKIMFFENRLVCWMSHDINVWNVLSF